MTYMTKYLSIEEAAEYLRISKNTLYGLNRTGGIPYYKIGKKCIYIASELDDWISSRKN